jgi:hypothetical protein
VALLCPQGRAATTYHRQAGHHEEDSEDREDDDVEDHARLKHIGPFSEVTSFR